MISENFILLINKLKIKTINNEAIWSKTSRDNEYKLDLGKGAITVDSYSNDGIKFVDLAIINDRGDLVDRIWAASGNTEDYGLLMELHALARRAFYKVDETFLNIFKELDSNKIVGREDS